MLYSALLDVHSLLRWVVLILLFLNIIRHVTAKKRPYEGIDKKLGLWLMITAHVMLLIGLYQYFAGNLGFNLFKQYGSEVMKNSAYRFWAVEHITGMILAIILITMGRAVQHKPVNDKLRHKKALTYYFIALILILACIPWSFRGEDIARPLFPGVI